MLVQFCLSLLLTSAPLLLTDTANLPDRVTVNRIAVDSEPQPPVAAPAEPKERLPTEATVPDAGEAVSAPRTEKWRLRYKFTPNQQLRYQTHQTMTLEARLGESRRVDISELRQRRVFTVLSAEDSGAAHLAMQFEHVWMKKQIDELEPVEFDSTMKPADVPAAFRKVAHGLKGSAPKYWLSTQGQSLYPPADQKSVQPVANTKESAAKTSISLVEGDSKENSIELAVGSTSTTASPQTKTEADPGSFLMTLPEESVQVGDTWKETVSVPVRVTQEINRQVPILRTFRLESVENGIATISFRSSIETSVKGPTVRSQLIQATPRGTLRFDIERGVMLHREMRYNETVVGALGGESVLSSVGTNTESLIEDNPVNP